jgi:hypothetical protein
MVVSFAGKGFPAGLGRDVLGRLGFRRVDLTRTCQVVTGCEVGRVAGVGWIASVRLVSAYSRASAAAAQFQASLATLEPADPAGNPLKP